VDRLSSSMTLVWLIYFSFAELSSLLPSQASSCILISEEASTENYSGDYACSSMHEATFRLVRCIWDNASHDNVVAFGTILIAVFTYVLYRSTSKLWEAGEKQFKLARDEFISTHRPKLIVRQFVLAKPVPGEVIKVEFSIVNIGATEAIWRYIAVEVALWNGQYWEAPGLDHIVKPTSMPPLKNGQRAGMTIQSRFNITADQIAAIEQKKLIICAVGEFTYADAVGTQRRTSFRRNYDLASDMFIASPYSEHEYQD
jgi:hypothetical protein